jgi:citrate synthase
MTTTTAPETPRIHKGLAGVVVDTTATPKVVAETNSLTYRDYPVQEPRSAVSNRWRTCSGTGNFRPSTSWRCSATGSAPFVG